MYAIAHNAATFPRDMVLRVEAAPEVMKRLEGARVEVVGRRGSSMEIGSTITLKNMQPGENRWIGLSFNPPPGKEGELLFVNFYEQAGSVAVNGFAMGARLAPMARVLHDRMESHRSIFTRLSAILRDDRTEDEIEAAMELLERDQVSTKEYAEFMRRHLPVIRGSVRDLLKSQGAGDPFGAVKAISALGAALDSGKAELIAVAHDCSLNKLDSFLTMQQLSKGNVADILQNVRWQKDLYAKAPRLSRLECSSTVNRECARFIDGYGARKIGNKEYPELIRTLLGCLRETAEELSSEKLDVAIDIVEMERNLGDLTALQKAHRDYLLKLQSMRQ
jgi:hypothetical protein